MHHKENFGWFMNTEWCGRTLNAGTVNRNDTWFGIRKEIKGGVLSVLTG
jgi:hypothetical protein